MSLVKIPETIEEISYDWCFGKPVGNILYFPPKEGKTKNGSYQYRSCIHGKQHCKLFSIFETSEISKTKAIEYGIQWSFENEHTKNMIRRLPDGIYWKDDPKNEPVTNNTIEVKINDEYTFIVDFEDIKQIQQYSVSKSKSANKNAKYYALISLKGTREEKKNGKKMIQLLHNFLTSFKMVDHININPMDNRRCNLRETTKKQNNNNRSCEASGLIGYTENLERLGLKPVPGVRFVNDRPGGAWQARIKQDNKEKTKSFGIKKYGHDEALKHAVFAKMQFNKENNCDNSFI